MFPKLKLWGLFFNLSPGLVPCLAVLFVAITKALLRGLDALDFSGVLDVVRCLFVVDSPEMARKVNEAVRNSAIWQPVRCGAPVHCFVS